MDNKPAFPVNNGMCDWPIEDKLPHGINWAKRKVIFKIDPHKNCPAWRAK